VTLNPNYGELTTSAGQESITIGVNCKYCSGKGWIDLDELIVVPRKYVKDEYFEKML
jgi:hypothetical protein